MNDSDDQEYLKTLSILCVEDEESARNQLSQFLQRRCAAVYTAADGREGLAAFLQHHPDIVVTDILMPVMDGLKMGEAIRAVSQKTPIVIITAFEEPRYFQKAIDIGVDKYVTKPLNVDELQTALLKCARAIRAEAALCELRERSAELAEAQCIARLGHWRFAVASQCFSWSEESLRILEADAAQCGTSYAAFLSTIHPEDRNWVDQVYQAHLQRNVPYDIEHRLLLADGRVKYVHERCQTERDEAGRPLRSLGTVQDITERKLIEAELEAYRHNLEELVAVRTAELEKAKNQAESANRAKSVFLANMSHELCTPMNAILGFAQLMERDSALSEKQRGELQTIKRSGRHLLSLINDVLEISRIEAGRITLQNVTFDLADILHSIEETIRVRADSKGLVFALEAAGSLPRFVRGDGPRLRQVLINLLGNAVKYTERGQVSLRLIPAGDRIRFEVADTGAGIAPEDLAHIFQAFYQTENGIAKGEGTGLGLTISQEFVRLMGGEIGVTSEPGQGSVFVFTIPLPEADAPAIAPAQGRVVGLAPSQPTVRVLVAEDNADSRALLALLLKNAGFEVRAVENGRQAVETFQVWHPSFIWMDMRMPVLDGYEATKAIRALPGGESVKIAALTAGAFQEDRAAILAAGCDDMLATPIDEARLYSIMGQLLGLHYRYVGETVPATPDDRPLSPANFSALPEDMRNELHAAAELLDSEAVHAIVERMRADYPELAQPIAALLGNFRFDELARLCRDTDK